MVILEAMPIKKRYNYPVHKRANWYLDAQQKMHLKQATFHLENGNWIPYYYTYYYSVSGVIRFQNNFHHAVKLGKTERNLLEHLTQVMKPETNAFGNKDSDRQAFISFMKQHCRKTYKDKTVSAVFARLKKTVYVIKRTTTKELIINPLYYSRGTMAEHKALLQSLLNEGVNGEKPNPEIMRKMKFDSIKAVK